MKHKTLTPKAASTYMGVCKHTVLKWLKSGALKGGKLPESGYYRIESDDLIEFMQAQGMRVPELLLEELPSCIGDRPFAEIVRVIDSLPVHRRRRAYNSLLPYLKGLAEAI